MFSQFIRQKLQEFCPDEDLCRWFDPLKLAATDYEPGNNSCPEKIHVLFPHSLFEEWFNTSFKQRFEDCLKKLYPDDSIKILYGDRKKNNTPENFLSAKTGNEFFIKTSGSNDPDNSFENFLFNKKNSFPVEAAINFTKGNGHSLFTIYADTGMGKSHILKAMYYGLSENVNKKDIFFSTLSELETFFSSAFKKSESTLSYMTSFRYVLIDDLHECINKKNLQEAFSRLIELGREKGISCVFTMNSRPAECAFFDEKFRSLLESGLVLELKKPDMDIKRQYVNQCAKKSGLHLAKEEELSIARMYSGFRQIHGAVLKISEYSQISGGKKLPLDEILKNSKSPSAQELTPDKIILSVSGYFNLDPAQITGKNRRQDIVFARHLAMYLCRELLGAQLGAIGEIFSNRDHSSVIYSVNKIKKLSISNKDTNNMLTEVKNLCFK